MQELIEFILKSIVNDTEAVKVDAIKEDRFTLYKVTVAEGDIGSVIGKGGKIAEAIRTIAKTASQRERIRIKFDTK